VTATDAIDARLVRRLTARARHPGLLGPGPGAAIRARCQGMLPALPLAEAMTPPGADVAAPWDASAPPIVFASPAPEPAPDDQAVDGAPSGVRDPAPLPVVRAAPPADGAALGDPPPPAAPVVSTTLRTPDRVRVQRASAGTTDLGRAAPTLDDMPSAASGMPARPGPSPLPLAQDDPDTSDPVAVPTPDRAPAPLPSVPGAAADLQAPPSPLPVVPPSVPPAAAPSAAPDTQPSRDEPVRRPRSPVVRPLSAGGPTISALVPFPAGSPGLGPAVPVPAPSGGAVPPSSHNGHRTTTPAVGADRPDRTPRWTDPTTTMLPPVPVVPQVHPLAQRGPATRTFAPLPLLDLAAGAAPADRTRAVDAPRPATPPTPIPSRSPVPRPRGSERPGPARTDIDLDRLAGAVHRRFVRQLAIEAERRGVR
jgi:hypothetical protein